MHLSRRLNQPIVEAIIRGLVCFVLIVLAPATGRAADPMDDPAPPADGATISGTDDALPPAEAGPPATIAVPDAPAAIEDAPSSSAVPLTTTQMPTNYGGGPVPPAITDSIQEPVVNYEPSPSLPPFDASTTEQLMMEDEQDVPLLGVDVSLDQRKLRTGEKISGLLILAVSPGSPAAIAGLQAFSHKVTSAVESVVMAAVMIAPVAAPAVMVVPLLESSHVGEHYDLIVAIDGYRVTNLVDMEDALRDARPGDTLYLSLVRDGKRLQLPLKLPRQSVLQQYAQ